MGESQTSDFPSSPDRGPSARSGGRLALGWANRSLRTKGFIVVAIPLIVLVFVVPAYYVSQQRAEEASSLVVKTLEVRNQIEQVQNLYQDASLRVRGYLLTGSDEFLVPYRTSVSALPSALQRLRVLARDDPVELRRVSELEPIGQNFLDVLDRLRLGYRSDRPAANERALVSRTRVQLDSIRSVLDQMRVEETRTLESRRADAGRVSLLSTIAIGVSVPVALLIGVVAMLLFTTGIGRRVQQLAENARRLPREEPLIPVPEAPDEIGRLGIALRETALLLEQRQGALARSDERYRTLARNFPNGIVAMFDHDLRYTMAEGPGLEALDIRGTDLEGKTIWETSAPEVVEVLEPCYRGALEGHISVRELRTRGRTLLTHYLPVEGESGAIAAGMVVSLDITERQEAEEETERLQAFLDSVVENIPNMIFVKDAERLSFVRFNKAGEELLGVPRAELIGMSDYDLFPKEEADFFTAKDREVLTGGVLVDIPEEPIETAGGERILHTKKIPILNDEGEPEYLLGISEDITERKEADAKLREAKEEAERASQAKDQFLSRMSHELRTPMNSVLGFAQLLEMDSLGGEQLDGVRQILRAGRHLLGLIDEVLDISRIATGGLTLSAEPIGVSAALQEAIELVQPMAAQRGIDIHAADANGLHILADHQRLKQVLLNLLSNAVKYNRDSGTIEISWHESDEHRLRLGITDTGPGIPPDRMDRLFTPFDRLGADQTTVEGAGLGLALSTSLVEAMGGTLEAESSIGSGSTFTIDLPLAEEPLRHYERAVKDAEPPSGPGGKRSVLYVEDNAANLALIERIFETRPNVRLLTAIQGRLGVELAKEHRPDLILMDLHLPDISGQEALRQLREEPATRDIPVVVISADATNTTVKGLLAAGATDYLTKPLEVNRFLRTLDALL